MRDLTPKQQHLSHQNEHPGPKQPSGPPQLRPWGRDEPRQPHAPHSSVHHPQLPCLSRGGRLLYFGSLKGEPATLTLET